MTISPNTSEQPHMEYLDLSVLNRRLARSLRTLHDQELDFHAHKLEFCTHPLTRPEEDAGRYCKSKLCLECRRWRALEERRSISRLLEAACRSLPHPLMFFQTLTLRDCTPAELASRAAVLVGGFKKLRRKLPRPVLGWTRVIETKKSDQDPALENVHLHFVALFPSGLTDKVRAIDWETLWKESAGELARDTDPNADFARDPAAVLNYLAKGCDWDFAEDGVIGSEDPRRYVYRVQNAHAKFSGGGRLRLKIFSEADKLDGFDVVLPRSSVRSRRRRARPEVFPDIPIEKAKRRKAH